jgi:hypothetical protein
VAAYAGLVSPLGSGSYRHLFSGLPRPVRGAYCLGDEFLTVTTASTPDDAGAFSFRTRRLSADRDHFAIAESREHMAALVCAKLKVN